VLVLVCFIPNRGGRVRTLSHAELEQAFLVRAELEALVTEIAAPTLTAEGMRGLQACELGCARVAAHWAAAAGTSRWI
jgi:DNA-binding GntR family transcriptional regulator